MDRPALVLFDIGGVLMRLSGVSQMRALTQLVSDDEVWARWLTCEWVRRFERGLCGPDEFASGVVHDWELPITAIEFAERFRGWPDGLYPGAAELVAETRALVPVGCLSNSNALHWPIQIEWGVADWFDHTFVSHEMGLIKPDPDVFEHVATQTGVEPQQIAFIDDNILNVDAAIEAGFDARLAQGVDQARAALVDALVLSS